MQLFSCKGSADGLDSDDESNDDDGADNESADDDESSWDVKRPLVPRAGDCDDLRDELLLMYGLGTDGLFARPNSPPSSSSSSPPVRATNLVLGRIASCRLCWWRE